MHNGNVVRKCFVICMVLFCAYMQWSPVVDFDYVWIHGHEHHVGAANLHQAGSIAVLSPPRAISSLVGGLAYQLLTLPVSQSTERLVPATTLRL